LVEAASAAAPGPRDALLAVDHRHAEGRLLWLDGMQRAGRAHPHARHAEVAVPGVEVQPGRVEGGEALRQPDAHDGILRAHVDAAAALHAPRQEVRLAERAGWPDERRMPAVQPEQPAHREQRAYLPGGEQHRPARRGALTALL